MRFVKTGIRKLFRLFGRDIVGYHPERLGLEAYRDMSHFAGKKQDPLIIDVGANVGQSVEKFRERFERPRIHSFEPSPGIYERLEQNWGQIPGVHTWNYGLGSDEGSMTLLENRKHVWSSFLRPTELALGEIVDETEVEVLTLDGFAQREGIDFIYILKSDAQGYDYEVLKGAEGLLREDRIALVYFECIYSEQYKHIHPYYDTFRFLAEHGYSIVNFYNPYMQEEVLSWNDVLWINDVYHRKQMGQGN